MLRTNIYLPLSLLQELQSVAEAQGKTMSAVIRELLQKSLNNHKHTLSPLLKMAAQAKKSGKKNLIKK